MPQLRFLRPLMTLAFLLGCARGLKPQPAVDSPGNVVALARERPVPDMLRARFHIKLKSKALDIAGSTGGGLVVARPGRGYFAVLGPLGGPIVTFAGDGQGLAVLLARDKRHLVASDADAVIDEITDGAASLDDLWAVLVGDLPFDDVKIKTWKAEETGVRAVFLGPRRTMVIAMLDPVNGTVQSLEARRGKKLLLQAVYGEYKEVDGQLLPSEVDLTIPSLELNVHLRYKTWKTLDSDELPDVFGMAPPDGISSEPLEDMVRKWADRRSK